MYIRRICCINPGTNMLRFICGLVKVEVLGGEGIWRVKSQILGAQDDGHESLQPVIHSQGDEHDISTRSTALVTC